MSAPLFCMSVCCCRACAVQCPACPDDVLAPLICFLFCSIGKQRSVTPAELRALPAAMNFVGKLVELFGMNSTSFK